MRLSIKTIKGKILLGNFILIIFPILFLAIYSYNTYVKSIQTKTKTQMDIVVKCINVYFDQFFSELNALSQFVVQNDIVQAALNQPSMSSDYTIENLYYEMKIFKHFEDLLRTKPLVESILVFGDNDMNYFYHKYKTWNPSVNSRNDDWYKKAVEANGKWVFSSKRNENQLYTLQYPNIDTKSEVITLARVIKNNQNLKPIGILAINIRSDFVDEISQITNVNGAINIMDSNKNIILETHLKDNEKYISIEQRSDATGLTVSYNYPTRELYNEIVIARRMIIFICILLIIISMIFAFVISSWISKPLKVLKGYMKQVSEGIFKTIAYSKINDEVQEMYKSYNIMVNKIEDLICEISIKEQQRIKTELYAIQVTINPHFIYNTLNCIRWAAILEKNKFIADMIASFIYLLKKSVSRRKEYISIREEIEFISGYSKLMGLRYDNFSLNITTQDGIQEYLILPFLIQPLVENAIFHGIAPLKERKGIVFVNIQKNGEKIEAVIGDNGVGIEQSKIGALIEADSGLDENMLKIGVGSVYKRMKIQYGNRGSFEIVSKYGEGTTIKMSWPAELDNEVNKND